MLKSDEAKLDGVIYIWIIQSKNLDAQTLETT